MMICDMVLNAKGKKFLLRLMFLKNQNSFSNMTKEELTARR